MNRSQKELGQWVALLLVFVFTLVLLPLKAEAVTREQALNYSKKLGIAGYPLAVRYNGELVAWNWDGTWRSVPEHVNNNVATILGNQVDPAVKKTDGSLVYFTDDPYRPDIVETNDVIDIDSTSHDSRYQRVVVLKSDGTAVTWAKEQRFPSVNPYAQLQTFVYTWTHPDIEAITAHSISSDSISFFAGLQLDKNVLIAARFYDWWYYADNYSTTKTNQGRLIDIAAGEMLFGTEYRADYEQSRTRGYAVFTGLKDDGSVVAWATRCGYPYGPMYYCSLLGVVSCNVPSQLQGGVQDGFVVDIAGNSAFSLALKYDGSVVAWNYKFEKQTVNLGQVHTLIPQLLTVPEEVQSGVIAIKANCSSNYAMALKSDGSVVVWDVNGKLLPVPEGLNLLGAPGTNPDTVGQWGLDSVKNSIAYDTGGQNNNGIISGATLTTGIISNALQFDGVDDKVTFSYSKPENNFTLEAWVKPTEPHQIDTQSNSGTAGTAGQKYIFGANQEGANGGIGVSVGTNGISVYEHGDGYMPALAVYNGAIGTDWVHIVVVVENQTPKIYLNGQLVRTGVKSTRPKSIAPTILGYGPYGAFKGNIDEVALYQKALTAQEIKQAYEKVVFLENITITNKDNNETTAQCTFGSHLNKIEFNLKKKVTQLNLVLDLPSNIKIGQILKITRDNVNIPTSAATITGGNQITINQELQTGHYKIEFLITINEQLIVKTKTYSDEKKVFTNTESGIFELRFMDFGSLPNVT